MEILYDICGKQERWYIASVEIVEGAKILRYESGYLHSKEEAEELLPILEKYRANQQATSAISEKPKQKMKKRKKRNDDANNSKN